ncbi:hypothetical protein [Paenibacillus zanthoxyli]|uniref:hypothetical protein n=1 Tax=Paenibacillus zanthoxyli TaxID=369399 RepID=UPI0004B25AF8|nr:hypothetical protein [Paenibacillus zanthoxyli]
MAVIMAIISATLGSNASLETMEPSDLTGAIRMAFVIDAVIALLGILVSFIAFKQKNAAVMEVKSAHE